MTDNQIKELYKAAYCQKNAAAIDDFLNWLRQLFGMKRKNSTGENVAAWGTGIGAAGGAAYGGYKGYKKLQDFGKGFASDSLINKGLGKVQKLPRWGKGTALGVGAALTGALAGKTYDKLFNE